MSTAEPVRIERADLNHPRDFVQVRASLVRKLRDANAAIVVAALETWTAWRGYTGDDGHSWWRGTYEDIAEITGLSADQVKRVVVKLAKRGDLVTGQERAYDRTKSYRIIVADGDAAVPPASLDVPAGQDHRADSPDEESGHRADSPDASGGSAGSIGRIRPMDRADSPDVHMKKKGEKGEKGQTPPPLPTSLAIATQCPDHQDKVNHAPCGACGTARTAYLAAAEAAAAAKRERLAAATMCPTHPTYYAHNCGGCRADKLAGDAA